ncbi:MAG: acyl-CoA dehydrogenase family protein [Mycobacteriales bacterium]|nr:acyl-CoA dehydrogenase family protein [Mycobacteriales bacterium]
MHFGLTDEALALREGVRDVLAKACTPDVVRASWTDDTVTSRLWSQLGELGLLGLLVPEGDGGLGLTELVAVAALEEAGWAGVPGPLVETVAFAPLLVGTAALDDVLAGRARTTVQRSDGPVPGAAVAELVVQVHGGVDGVRLLHRGDAVVTPVETVDASRQAALVSGVGEPLTGDALLALLRGTLGTAAFLLGLARRQLDLTVAYVSDRRQFGVPVGSFQAVKHPLADAAVGTELAWPTVLRAAHSLATDDADAAVHVSAAKALASDAAYSVSRACLQAHGAMAYTVEYDLHLFAKRTWALARDWGSSTEHRAVIADHLRLEEHR